MGVERIKTEFEEWARESIPGVSLSPRMTNVGILCEGDEYHSPSVQRMYEAWQASRAALVVELPEPHAHLIWIQAGRGPDDYWDDVEVSRSKEDKCCDGSGRYRVYSEFEVSEAIRRAGITVKGLNDG